MIFNKTLPGILILILLTVSQEQADARGSLVAYELDVHENTLDDCTSCGCRFKGELEPAKSSEWWFTLQMQKRWHR